jgi:DNA-binding XRE family transcriptional regulator
MLNYQTEERKGRKFAILPLSRMKKIQRQLAALEEEHDATLYDAIKERIANGSEEILPHWFIEREMAGESPVRLWREYRNMTQEHLAEAAGVSRQLITKMERTGDGSMPSYKAVAAALGVSLDDIA